MSKKKNNAYLIIIYFSKNPELISHRGFSQENLSLNVLTHPQHSFNVCLLFWNSNFI